MRRFFALSLLTAVLLAAPAAHAGVQVESNALPAPQASALEARLKEARVGHFEILFTRKASGKAVAKAKAEFERRDLKDNQAMIVVAIEDRQVGVHVGHDFTEAGVSNAAINAIVQRAFVPLARSGDYPGAALALATALEAAGQDQTPALTRRATALQEAVQAQLQQASLGHVRVDIQPTQDVTAAFASSRFAELLLLPYEALLVKNVDDQRVWPVLGKAYQADEAAIQRAVEEAYTPLATRGDVQGGLTALARRLATFHPGPVPAVTPWRAAVDRAPAIRARLKAEGLGDYLLAFDPGPVAARQRRDYRNTTIVVFPKSRAILVEPGPVYGQTPLPDEVLSYGALASQGDVEGEILALARKLEQARQPFVAEKRNGQLLVGLSVAGVCGGLGVVAYRFLSRRRRKLQGRLKGMESRHQTLLSQLLKADEASRRHEAAQGGMQEVAALSQALLEAAQAIEKDRTAARQHLAGWRLDPAEEALDQLTERTPMLEMGAAAMLTAYQGGTDPAEADQRVKAANQAALDWQELSAASRALRPVLSKLGRLDQVDKLLKDARKALTEVPVALESAQTKLAEARTLSEAISEGLTLTKTIAATSAGTSGLDGLAARRALNWEMARVRYDVVVPTTASAGSGDWTPAGSSASGSWDAGASSSGSWGSGSSADDSWKSKDDDRGSSGGGSW